MSVIRKRKELAMKKAIIIPNYLKEESVRFSKTAEEKLIESGYAVEILAENQMPSGKADFALVLGGDGTMLRACKKLYEMDIAMLGINFGNLGYLTECNPDTALEAINKIMQGEYTVENRIMIKGQVVRDGKAVYDFSALNEVAFFRASLLKAFNLDILINGMHTQTVVGDGLIVATPTGSTSYNLSAGGPVLTPTADNMVLTAVSPIYYPRSSLVINGSDKLDIKVSVNSITKTGNPSIQIDGDECFEIFDGDLIRIEKHNKQVNTIKITNSNFYQVLSKKLSKATYDNT